jgi:hypothetical protein
MANENRNESFKLLANWCNSGSIAVITTGAVIPVISVLYKWSERIEAGGPNWSLAVICVCAGLFLHAMGHAFLQGVIDNDE